MVVRRKSHVRRHRGKKFTKLQKREIKTLIGHQVETKRFGFGQDAVACNTTGTIISLSDCAQGVGTSQHVGDDINIKRLIFNYQLVASAGGAIATADTYDTVRVVLWRFKENDGALAPVVGNILNNYGSSASLVNAMYTLDQNNLFHVIYDSAHMLYNTPVYTTSAQVEPGYGHSFKTKKPMVIWGKKLGAGRIQYYNGTVNGTNKIFMLIVSDSLFTPHPTITYQGVLEFTDE